MRPTDVRFRLVEALRLAAIQAERCGGQVQVVDADGEGSTTTRVQVSPRSARLIADELERRWAS